MAMEKAHGLTLSFSYSLVPGLRLYEFDPSRDVYEVMAAFEEKSNVMYAEPEFPLSCSSEAEGSNH